MLNYNFLVLGFAIVGLLFVPPLIPYMIPIAEASPMDNPADAINDLSLTSISKYSNQADRNSITLSWSAPNDNGSPILFYNIQVHSLQDNGWIVLENDVYGTTYTHENAPTSYQFSYRVFAIAADGCNGSSSTFYNACNESNILHVVSLPNAESGAVNSSCNNSDLDDCGYFDTEKIDTCFNRSGYSIPGVVDVTEGGNEFVFSGKLSPKENGQCMGLNDDYFLPNKSVTILAEKGTQIGAGNEQKSVTVVTNSDGSEKYGFVATFSFTDASDVGQWRILFDFAGDSEYNPTEDNFSPQFTITVTEIATGPFTITSGITLNANNGGECSDIGVWDGSTKTCTLTSDVLISSSDNAISIPQSIDGSTSGLTIDGAGYTITGPGIDSGHAGIKIYKSNQIKIKNLTIKDFTYGINSAQSNGITIIENTIQDTFSTGIVLGETKNDFGGGTGILVSNNTIQDVDGNGIYLSGFIGNETCNETGGSAYNHAQSGIHPVTIKNNLISNAVTGIEINESTAICVTENNISEITLNGVFVGYFVHSQWKSGIAEGHHVISNNVLSSNLYHGLVIGSTNSQIIDNTANNNKLSGIIASASAINNVITGNTANNNIQSGFNIHSDSIGNTFTRNTATGNGVDFVGISQESSFTITDDSTGGDCTSIGTWSSASKTCQLTTNLTHGIIIGSNDITLDGGGRTITGTYTALNPSAATFTEGILVDGKTGVTLSNVEIYNVPTGIYLSSSENNWIVHSRLIDNGYGVSLYDSPNNKITNTNFQSEDGYGIKVDHSHLNVITSNTFFAASSGISVSNSNQLTIDDNTFLSNQHGVYLHSVGSISVLDNIFESNSQSGMRIDGAGWHTITGNTFKDGLSGIQCSGSESNTISNNIITNNKPSNFGLAGTSQAMSFGTCSNNVISNNQITDNNQGIELNSSDGNTVSSNTISNNDGNAIRLLGGSGNIITDNTVNNNQGIGFLIESNSDPVTFTGNTATGNTVNDFKGICQGSSCETVSVDSLSIGQHGSNAGGDCDSVGTWVPTDPNLSPVGGTCTLSKDIEITGNGVGIWLASSRVTVDGAEHTVTGSQTSGYDHVGVKTCNQCALLEIKDLTINNFSYGIMSNYANGLTITGVTVTDIGKTAMSLGGSANLLVENNIINVNLPNSWYGGINIDQTPTGGANSDGSCAATGAITAGGTITIRNNQITGATLATSDGIGYCIDGNTIADSPGMNISYANDQVSPTNHIIKNNIITGGGGFKIIGSGNTFDSNTVTGGSIGFHNEHRAHDNIFTNNIANNNSQHGFKFDECEGSGYPECNATPVKFTGNTATGNGVSDFKGAPASCFASSGYSAVWTQDPDTSSRDVTFSGKLAPKQNDQCTLSNELFLDAKTVVVTATKDSVTKSVSATTDDGFFNSLISFGVDSDEGTWTITWFYAGDELYPSTNEFGNGSNSFTLDVPAPPPNLPPIVNVPNDITLYTGTPSFSFAQSTINYNLYSGNSGPVFYPQPTASITGVSSQIATFVVTATDDDLSSGPTCDVTSGSEFPVGTTTVTCTASDSDGGVGTASFDVTVIEQTISGSPTCTPGSNSQFPIGSTPVSCSVNDGQGNASTDTFAVNVQPKSSLSDSQCRAAAGSGTNFGSRDETGSVFVCEYPFHVTVEEGQRLVWVDTQPWQGFYRHSVISSDWLNQAAGAPLFGFNSDSGDNIGVAVTPSSWGGIGTYQFYDGQNPTLTGSITIAESDTTAPNVNVPNDLVISTEDQNGTPVVTYSVSASDDREVISGPTCNVQSGSAFSIGTTKVTCTASDAAGNTGTDSFDVTVEYTYIDTTPPGFAAYDNISRATTNPAGTVVTYTLPTVTDNIGVTSGPTCDLPSGSIFPIGTTEVTCTASDAANNSASISFNVVMTKTYVDNTAPAVYITFGETSDEMTIPADSSSGKELGFTVNAIDNVGVTVGPICSDAGFNLGLTPIGGQPGFYTIDSKMYPIGNSFVVCTAYDAAGNSGSSIFAVTVSEYSAPTAPFTILDDSTGGDCQHIGTWNAASKTCTITEDITADSSDAIIIGSDGITLQGDVNIQGVTTNYSYFGILVDGKSNIILKDFNLLDFKYGVMAKNIDTLTIKDVTSDSIGQYVVNYQVDNSNNVIVENLVSSSNNRCYGQTYGCESELFITNNNNVVIRDSYSGTIKMGNSHNVELSNVNVGGGHPNYGYGIISIADRSSNVNIHDSTFSKLNTSGGQFGISYAQDGGCSQSDVPRVCTSVGTVGTGVVIKNNEIISGMGASGLGASFTISGNTFTNAYNHGCGLSFSAGNHINKLWGNGGHIISDNSFSCPGNSIYIIGNDGTVISGNTFQDANSGIKLKGSQNNEIFENNFINIINPVLPLNTNNVAPDPHPRSSAGNNVYDNFWTGFDSASEQCYNDGPFDKFCDSSFSITPETYRPDHCQGSCPGIHTVTLPFLTPWVMQNGEMPSTPIESPPDTTFPTISIPSSQTIQTTDQSGIIVNYGAVTATDDRTVTSGPTCDVESGTLFTVGDTVVTCTASDAADNVSTSSFTITVVFSELDTTAPIVLTPDDIAVVTTESQTTVSFVNATATDNVAVTSGPNCNPSSGSLFSVGNSTVVCSASDAAGNTGSARFTINVVESIFAGSNTFEPGVSFSPGKDFSKLGIQTFEGTATFGEFTEFAKSQEFSNSMTFGKYQHFEDSTDFTATPQTFKEGTTFGDGTTFRSDGTQLLPVGTIPSFGVMLEEFSCVTADCKPTDTSKFLSPGDFLPSGIDPAASFSRITSADKSLTIDGLGLVMTFDNVFGDGTIKTDLYDPANIPSSTDVGNGKVSVITSTSESISTIGSVIDLSAGTATVSGSITITMPYLESNVPVGTAESDLVVLHYTNNQWVTESNCTVDTVNNKITCIVTELSPFGIGSRSVTQTSENEITLDVDDIPPEFEKVNNILVDATTSNGATVTYETPKATDDGGITDTPVCEPESGSFFPIGTTPVTCTVKDIAGIQGATVFLVTVKSLIAAPVEIPNNVSIKIGKSDYNTKEAIFVSGVAAPFTEDNVSINVQDQSDNLVLSEQITPESSGIYTGIIFPNSLWSVSGNYTMSATYGTATDSVPFTFEYIQTEIDNSNIPTGITLNTNSTGYSLGDMISVTSQLTGGTSGQSIIVDVKDESGDNVVLQSLNTDDSGSTSLFFKAQDTWIPGKYNVTATDGSPLWDYSTSKLIQLVRPLPEITISPTVTTTESGDVITSYKAGEIGYFSTALVSESTSNVLVTINVVDAADTTLGVAFFKSIIGKGDSELVLGFKIPEDAADGAAKIYVNTYTDWIDQGGIAISSELLSEVNIEGVISVENISDDGTVLVTPKSGSSVPGCEQSIQGCYLPNPTIINVGDTVSFSNTDTVPHTFTSGSPSNGPNGIFDSSLLMSGEKYEFTFEDEGKYDYFDMIHPWMTGTIIVGNSESYTTLPENTIPKFSDISDIVQSASSSVGNAISYPLPIAIGGVITSGTTCTPAPGSMFQIGSTQVTCTATNEIGNTGMTSFMVTINPIPQTADQSLSVKVGKDLYNNLEPLFVTGSVGKITEDSINLEVYDELNHLISIEQTTPKESGVYNTIITSNELWSISGEYTIIAKYDDASAQDTFEFKLVEVEEIISEQIPTELYVSTDNSAYILGDDVFIEMQLVGAGAGESILLEVRDSQNDQVLLQSLNTDSDGNASISYQLESTYDSGIYSVIVASANWDFITTETFVAVAQIPDITIGDVVSTLQDGTEVDSFESGDIGYFQIPIISNSTSNVLIAVNIFDVENTPLGLAYFNSKVVGGTFDIVLGLQIPENVIAGLATVYINTYTDWPNEGGVPILEEQVSFIEISPLSVSDLTLSTNPTSTNSAETVP